MAFTPGRARLIVGERVGPDAERMNVVLPAPGPPATRTCTEMNCTDAGPCAAGLSGRAGT